MLHRCQLHPPTSTESDSMEPWPNLTYSSMPTLREPHDKQLWIIGHSAREVDMLTANVTSQWVSTIIRVQRSPPRLPCPPTAPTIQALTTHCSLALGPPIALLIAPPWRELMRYHAARLSFCKKIIDVYQCCGYVNDLFAEAQSCYQGSN